MSDTENLFDLVSLGKESPLRVDLNKGVVSLWAAQNTQLRPHVCLNKEEGLGVIEKVRVNPETANTAYWLTPCFVVAGEDVWLNTMLSIFLDKYSSDNHAQLSPQQTGYIVRNLPTESRNVVLGMVKAWFVGKVLPDIQKGLRTIREQFEKGNPLLESDHGNRIFDIHGGRHSGDIPYTETVIVGEELFWSIVHGHTLYKHNCDGYTNADEIISGRWNQQKAAVNEVLGTLRGS